VVSAEGAAGFIVCGCVAAETHPADAKAISAIDPLNRIKTTPKLRCERYHIWMAATLPKIKRHDGDTQLLWGIQDLEIPLKFYGHVSIALIFCID
jgi:hypothetical protein